MYGAVYVCRAVRRIKYYLSQIYSRIERSLGLLVQRVLQRARLKLLLRSERLALVEK